MSQDNENQEAVEYVESRGSFLERVPSWLVSMIVHTIALTIMMFVQVDQQAKTTAKAFTSTPDDEVVEEEVMEEEEEEELDMDLETDIMESEVEADVSVDAPQDVTVNVDVADTMDDDPPPAVVEFTPLADIKAASSDNNASINSYTSGSGLEARRNADNVAMTSGGTRASQNAVKQGLEWIARHQLPNGSWNYNHCLVGGGCNCGNPGAMMKCTNGATAMGILPFLGCGMTHREGTYKTQVSNGLNFLVNSMKKDKNCPTGGSLHQAEGTMYAHGLATICLTEAYAMTKEKKLQIPAQAAVNFVMYAQDPVGGGWRYNPRQPGDTSVVGWQLMALKSGYMGYLQINQQVPAKAMNFLNSVQTENGAKYGYTTPGGAPACTAIALLCRMYYGWKQDNPSLQKGVEFLDKCGPSNDMYYNYYATQVMRHYGGDMWTRWNERMREQLVKKQTKGDGHDKGSWTPGGGHAAQGGRLYETALSIMTLEVYYRHQPIYKAQSMDKPPALE